MNEHKCNVLISDLIKAPFHYYWGDSIWARVVAVNVIGESVVSADGNGAIILTKPDAPVNLQNVPLITAKW